jgi:ubiquinone/menaquinone biosynthesis C-methylase UbiE
MSFEDRARREVDFSLRAVDLESLSTDEKGGLKVLDLACGIGEHAREIDRTMRGRGTEVSIDARDLSPELIEQAQTAAIEEEWLSSTRERIDFAMGDFLNIQKQVAEGTKYQLITVLGSSFMFLKNKEEHERALKGFYELLAPGGRIVIQFREGQGQRTPEQEEARSGWGKELGVGVSQRAVTKDFGKFASKGTESLYTLHDQKEGDAFYFYNVPPEKHPAFEGLEPIYKPSGELDGFANSGTTELMYTAVYKGNGKLDHFDDSDGVGYSGFGRAYVDSGGDEYDLGGVYVVDYISEKGAEVLKSKIMPGIGFQNIHLERESLSTDGSTHQFALVAEKPA